MLIEEKLITNNMASKILSWRHTGFSAHTKVHIDLDDKEGLQGLAQYTIRCPISEDKIILLPDKHKKWLHFVTGKNPSSYHYHPLKKKPRLVSFDIDDVLQQLLSEDMGDLIELFKKLKALDIIIAITSANPDVLRWFSAMRDQHHELANLIDYCEYTESHIQLDQYEKRLGISKEEIIHFGNCWVGRYDCPSAVSLHEQGFVSVAVDQRLMYSTENIMNKKVDAVVFDRLTIQNVLDIVESYRFTPPDNVPSGNEYEAQVLSSA